MSTRAVYTFRDADSEFHVYKHHDGYPTGAAQWIETALKLAWPLPRFEADEFAAAFIAANKDGGGGVRLLPSGKAQDVASRDIEYRYEIGPGNSQELRVIGYATDYWESEKKEEMLFNCRIEDFAEQAVKWEKEGV